jgi:catalase (peroxidase I)
VVNSPPELAQVLPTLEPIQQAFNAAQKGGTTQVSLGRSVRARRLCRRRAGCRAGRVRRAGAVQEL